VPLTLRGNPSLSRQPQVPLSQDRGKLMIMIDEEQFLDLVRRKGVNQPEQAQNQPLSRCRWAGNKIQIRGRRSSSPSNIRFGLPEG